MDQATGSSRNASHSWLSIGKGGGAPSTAYWDHAPAAQQNQEREAEVTVLCTVPLVLRTSRTVEKEKGSEKGRGRGGWVILPSHQTRQIFRRTASRDRFAVTHFFKMRHRRTTILPRNVYFGHAGKAIVEESKKIPVIGDAITDVLSESHIKVTEELPERPLKRQKTIKTIELVEMPNATISRNRDFRQKKMTRKTYQKKKTYGTQKKNALPVALRAQETKRAAGIVTTVILDAGQEAIVSLANPLLNQNPLNQNDFVSTASGKSIYSMGIMLWVTVSNVSPTDNYTFFLKTFEVHANANASLGGIYWDSSTGSRVPLANLHQVDRYNARTHVGQGFTLKKSLAKTLSAKDNDSSGASEANFKVWLPTMEKLHWEDSKFNKSWQARFYCFKTTGEGGAIGQVMNARYDYVHYFKD